MASTKDLLIIQIDLIDSSSDNQVLWLNYMSDQFLAELL